MLRCAEECLHTFILIEDNAWKNSIKQKKSIVLALLRKQLDWLEIFRNITLIATAYAFAAHKLFSHVNNCFVLFCFLQWYYLLSSKHIVDSLNCVVPCILTFINVSESVANYFKRAETYHSQQPYTSINIFYCANAHFLAAYQEFCIGMHWAGDPYLINFIWHTQTSTFITMSDFPMLIQFKATASPFSSLKKE